MASACPLCQSPIPERTEKRGRKRKYCSERCNNQAFRDRKSQKVQADRQAAVGPCMCCGGPIALKRLGPIPTFCSVECSDVSRGVRLPEALPVRVCALPECEVEFVPGTRRTRCCSERHGKMLYNRESRADGRQQLPAWTDARRDQYHQRRAQKKGTSTGRPVLMAEIAERDGWTCSLCSEPVDADLVWPDPLSKSLDHVVPLSRGGVHDPSNVQLAHLRCNTAKGNRAA